VLNISENGGCSDLVSFEGSFSEYLILMKDAGEGSVVRGVHRNFSLENNIHAIAFLPLGND
jgi:hypothetical protein